MRGEHTRVRLRPRLSDEWIKHLGATDSRRSLFSGVAKRALGAVLASIGIFGLDVDDAEGHTRTACKRVCRRKFGSRQSQARRARCIKQCNRHRHRKPAKPRKPPKRPKPPARPKPSPIALGLSFPSGEGDLPQIDALAAQIGRMPAFVLWFEGWTWEGRTFGAPQLERLRAFADRGISPLISWDPWGAWFEPYGGPQPVDPQPYHLRNIVAGEFDATIDSWAAGLAAYGQPVFLSFAHEMNGDWFPWGVGVNGNTAADYVAAWRHLHDRFTAAGATNVRWVWTPNYDYGGPVSFAQVFPGNSFLDWVGVNGYNWGTGVPWADWLNFDTLFGPSYEALTALSTKPLMITETASAEEGGNKASWIVAAFLEHLPTRFPKVRAVSWYQGTEARTADGGFAVDGEEVAYRTDWRITSSDAARDAFVSMANSPYLQASLPTSRG